MRIAGRLTGGALWVAILFLVWNLIGVVALVSQATMDLDTLAKTDAYQAHQFATMPGWAWGAYAVAIFGGLLGSLALFVRSRLAVIFYLFSLGGIIVQFGRTFLATDMIAMRGWGTAAFPAFILLLALLQLWFAAKVQR